MRTIPYDPSAEAAVLACMMIDDSCVDDVRARLRESDFFDVPNKLIWRAILYCKDKGKADGLLVRSILEKRGKLEDIGGLEYLNAVIGSVPSTASVKYYVDLVADTSLRRQFIERSVRLADMAYDGEDIPILVDSADKVLSELCDVAPTDTAVSAFDAMQEAYEGLLSATESPLGSGPVLADILDGFVAGQLIVIGARPHHGKTSMAMHVLLEGLRFKERRRGLFFCYEMTRQDLALRAVSYESGVPFVGLKPAVLNANSEDRKAILQTINEFNAQYDIYFAGGEPSPYYVASVARKFHAKEPLSCVVVDYLQRMFLPGKQTNRNEEVGRISNMLKNLALELDIPVIVLAQLNRACDAREDHHPRMSDLRDSGTVEADADVIIMLCRQDAYEPDSRQHDHTIDVQVVKNRNGSCGVTTAMFDGPVMKIGRLNHCDDCP